MLRFISPGRPSLFTAEDIIVAAYDVIRNKRMMVLQGLCQLLDEGRVDFIQLPFIRILLPYLSSPVGRNYGLRILREITKYHPPLVKGDPFLIGFAQDRFFRDPEEDCQRLAFDILPAVRIDPLCRLGRRIANVLYSMGPDEWTAHAIDTYTGQAPKYSGVISQAYPHLIYKVLSCPDCEAKDRVIERYPYLKEELHTAIE